MKILIPTCAVPALGAMRMTFWVDLVLFGYPVPVDDGSMRIAWKNVKMTKEMTSCMCPLCVDVLSS